MRLLLIRHPKPDVAAGLCYGQSDVTCTAQDVAVAVARVLSDLPNPMQTGGNLWHSPLQRCEHCAQQIRLQRPDLTVKTDPRLVEMHFGPWELKPWASVSKRVFDEWTNGWPHSRPGGAASQPVGESLADMLLRVASALEDAALQPGQQIWVTHAGVVRSVLSLSRGQTQWSAATWPNESIEFGQVLAVDVNFDAVRRSVFALLPSEHRQQMSR